MESMATKSKDWVRIELIVYVVSLDYDFSFANTLLPSAESLSRLRKEERSIAEMQSHALS